MRKLISALNYGEATFSGPYCTDVFHGLLYILHTSVQVSQEKINIFGRPRLEFRKRVYEHTAFQNKMIRIFGSRQLSQKLLLRKQLQHQLKRNSLFLRLVL